MCRIAFAYLNFFGNAQQQSMGSLGRVTWLIVYLRSGLSHFGCLKTEQFLLHPAGCPLRSLLNNMPSETDSGCPREALAGDLPPATVRDRVGPDDAMSRAGSVKRSGTVRRSSTGKKPSNAPSSAASRSGLLWRPSAAASPSASAGTSPRSAQHASETATAGLALESGDDSDSSCSGTSSYESGADGEDKVGSELHKASQFSPPPTVAVTQGAKKAPMMKAASTMLAVGAADTHGKVRKASRQLSIVATSSLPLWPPIGSSWIEDGFCRLCEAALGTTPWGRATCPGCSVVDVCRFKRHPFKPLLLDWHPDISASKVVPQADEPTPTYQAIVPTPPMGKRAGLRGVTVPKMFAISAAFKQGFPQVAQISTSASTGRGS
jgi:hypothetical protein